MIYDRSVRTWLRLACAALGLMTTATPLALAQVSDVYLVSSFANNANSYNASQPIYIVNPGSDTEGPSSVCAAIYVFDDNQEMVECCSCPISNNGLLKLSVRDLSSQPVTAFVPKSGVIKIVSSSQDGPCDAKSINPQPRLRAWMVNLQVATIPPPVIFFPPRGNSTPSPMLSVTAFDQSALSADEHAFLPQACAFVQFLGTPRGKCSCPAGS